MHSLCSQDERAFGPDQPVRAELPSGFAIRLQELRQVSFLNRSGVLYQWSDEFHLFAR